MLEKIIFENHEGERIESAVDGIYINYNDLRDYEWEYTAKGDRITGFSRGVVEKTIPLVILCDSEQKGLEVRNNLFTMAEKDVLDKQPGKFIIGDYYLPGYIIESKKAKYLYNKRYMEISLVFATNSKFWIKETFFQYLPQNMQNNVRENLPVITGGDYPGKPVKNHAVVREFSFDFRRPSDKKVRYPQFDLPFDFVRTQGKKTLENPSFTDSNFIMTIYGFVDTPSILIAGHPYTIHTIVYEGERIEIDSAAGTVKKIGRMGEETNLYSARDMRYSVFQKIPPGTQTLSWPGTYGVDILLKDERSEPKWSL